MHDDADLTERKETIRFPGAINEGQNNMMKKISLSLQSSTMARMGSINLLGRETTTVWKK